MNLRAGHVDLVQRVLGYKLSITDAIGSLPDNPEIIRHECGNCFVLKSSALRNNWTTEFHDFSMQKRELIKLVHSSRFESIQDKLESAVKLGYYKDTAGYSHSLHPVMIKNLKEALCLS